MSIAFQLGLTLFACVCGWAQVTGVFARRGYNIQSLAVGRSEREGMSRICMVVPGSREGVDKLLRQLEKLVGLWMNITMMCYCMESDTV